MSQHVSVLLLGSNIGSKESNIELALSKLQNAGCIVMHRTPFLQSTPVEFDSCNNFCNIAVSITTRLSPVKLLLLIKKIEQQMGRKQDSMVLGKYEDRIIDIDIVKYEAITFYTKKLQIPHFKHLMEREFSDKLLKELVIIEEKSRI